MHTAERYHDFSAGHRVVGHENKCRFFHGHNYRVHFVCEPIANLDNLGRVLDFGVIKSQLCMWLESHWDHKMILWESDPLYKMFVMAEGFNEGFMEIADSIITVPFNPTAENMAAHLVNIVGPRELLGTGVILRTVRIDETRKCSASYTRNVDTKIHIVPEVTCGFKEASGTEGNVTTCLRLSNHNGSHNVNGEPA